MSSMSFVEYFNVGTHAHEIWHKTKQIEQPGHKAVAGWLAPWPVSPLLGWLAHSQSLLHLGLNMHAQESVFNTFPSV